VPGQPPIGHTKNFVIYDEGDQQSIVKSVMKRMGIDDKQLTPLPYWPYIPGRRTTCSIRRRFTCSRRIQDREGRAHLRGVPQGAAQANALDFDDLLLEGLRLLKSVGGGARILQPQVPSSWSPIPGHEPPQYELIRLLAGTRHNLFA